MQEAAIPAATTARPATRRRRSDIAIVPLATLALLVSHDLHAETWRFTPTAQISEIYTDNLRLTGAGTEQSDTITEFSPGFTLTGKSARIGFKMNYELQGFAYARSTDRVETRNILSAEGNAELVQDLFFLDGSASVRPRTVSPFGPQSAGNYNLNDNQAEVRASSLSPYLKHRFGDTAIGELRYGHESVNSEQAALMRAETDRIMMKIDSGTGFRTVGWSLQYDKRDIHYSHSLPVKMEMAFGALRYLTSPQFQLIGTAGQEKNSFLTTGEKPEGPFWSAGFEWTPNTLSKIEAQVGHRFFGRTLSLNASRRNRQSVWTIGYHDDITTTQSQFALPKTNDTAAFLDRLWTTSIPDADTRQRAVQAFIRDTGLPDALAENINTFTNRIFLQKSLQASLAFNGARSVVLVSAFNTLRESLGSPQMTAALPALPVFSDEDRTRQVGGNLLWDWKLSPTASINASTTYMRAKALTTRRLDTNRSARIGLTKRFRQKLKGTIELQRTKRSSEQLGDIRQNSATASISMSF